MRTVLSRFRCISSETAEVNMDLRIDQENRATYDALALLVARPGLPKKCIDDLLHKALGGYALWRLRAIRLGQSGCFSASAVLGFRQAAEAFMAKHQARAAAAEMDRARRRALNRESLERSRVEVMAQLARIESQLVILRDDGGDPAQS